jgi:hypothetical protein
MKQALKDLSQTEVYSADCQRLDLLLVEERNQHVSDFAWFWVA